MNDEVGKYESGISEDAGCYAEDDRAGKQRRKKKQEQKMKRCSRQERPIM